MLIPNLVATLNLIEAAGTFPGSGLAKARLCDAIDEAEAFSADDAPPDTWNECGRWYLERSER